ncbi:MAG: sulfotransferase domain-containing protein [Magnetococcales bacterium]|nr:sulfotransferase domain-containing protein [Magnetococcales bacterium]
MQLISNSNTLSYSTDFPIQNQLSSENAYIQLDKCDIGQKEFISRHIDSRIWNSLDLRSGDIILGSYAKSGTTWLQNILCQLVHGPSRSLNVGDISPWVESKYGDIHLKLDKINRQKYRRILKTHLPLHCLSFDPKVKYLYIARDAVDVAWSLHHHHSMANKSWYSYLNNQEGILGEEFSAPTPNTKSYFFNWLYRDGHPFWPYKVNVKSWWEARHHPNIFILHYKNLTTNFDRTILALASFLGLRINSDKLQLIRKYTSFQFMQQHAELFAPNGGKFWVGGGKTFFNKGKDGEWQSVLNKKEEEKYFNTLVMELGPECCRWIRLGVQDRIADGE